jgi:hypothetical protein
VNSTWNWGEYLELLGKRPTRTNWIESFAKDEDQEWKEPPP